VVVWWDDDGEPPHDTNDAKSSTIIGVTRAGSRLQVRTHKQAEPSRITVQSKGIAPAGKTT
jgi:hypothetical protein